MEELMLNTNKSYMNHSIVDDPTIFDGSASGYELSTELLMKLAKDLGFSYELYLTVKSIDHTSALNLVKSVCKNHNKTDVNLLVDVSTKEVLSYSPSDRYTLLNKDFMNTVSRLEGTTDALQLSEYYYQDSDLSSTAILKKVDPIIVEEKYEGRDSNFIEYNIGVLLVNSEVDGTYSRLLLYVENEPLYLPASFYNTSISRYRKSTENAQEALEVMILRVIDDLREDALADRIRELHYIYRSNKSVLATYEEYNTIVRNLRKMPTIIEDNSLLDPLMSEYEDFEKKYASMSDRRDSYIWRCTAVSDDLSVGDLVSKTARLLQDIYAPTNEVSATRELLGSYISTNRIAEEIASR